MRRPRLVSLRPGSLCAGGADGLRRRCREPDGRGGSGAGKQKPLGEVAAQGSCATELRGKLDALGHGEQVGGAGEGDDGGEHCVPVRRAQWFNKAAVDLERIDRELAEVADRGVAGAEVVDGDPYAEVAYPLQPLGGGGQSAGDDRALGELDPEPGSREAASGECAGDRVGETVGDLPG